MVHAAAVRPGNVSRVLINIDADVYTWNIYIYREGVREARVTEHT